MIDIDFSKKKKKPKLFIAKPNREIIGRLIDAYAIRRKIRIGNVEEMEFSLPLYIENNENHELIENPNIDKCLSRFLVKVEIGSETIWYVISNIKKTSDDDGDYNIYTCFSIPYMLNNKLITNYSDVSKNATQVLNVALSGTTWSIGNINAYFDTLYRSFDVSGSRSVLDFIQEIAETFGAIIIWDTVNKTISFEKEEFVGSDKGLRIKYGKLINNISVETNDDDFCTRLKLSGQNGLSINAINPIGTNYIEDFTFFLDNYEEDESGNIISHSRYMTDSLAGALVDYQQLLNSKDGVYEGLLEDKIGYQNALIVKNGELTVLEAQLETIEAFIADANATGDTENLPTYIAQKIAKEVEISIKKGEISSVEDDISGVNSNIENLQDEISLENNFTPEQLTELNDFIYEKEFSNENYTDAKQLLDAGKQYLSEYNVPKIVATVDMVYLLSILEESHNWHRFSIGDYIYINHEKLKVNIKAKMIEFDIDYEEGTVGVIISNILDIDSLNEEKRFIKDLYKSISSSNVVNMNNYKWNKASSTSNDVMDILNETWDANDRAIVASNNNSVVINKKGIRVYDPDDLSRQIILQNGVIGLSKDGGNHWSLSMTADGVIKEKIIIGKLDL